MQVICSVIFTFLLISCGTQKQQPIDYTFYKKYGRYEHLYNQGDTTYHIIIEKGDTLLNEKTVKH